MSPRTSVDTWVGIDPEAPMELGGENVGAILNGKSPHQESELTGSEAAAWVVYIPEGCAGEVFDDPPAPLTPVTADLLGDAIRQEYDESTAALAAAVAEVEHLTRTIAAARWRWAIGRHREAHRPIPTKRAPRTLPARERWACSSRRPLRVPPSCRPLVGAITRHGPPTPIGSRRCLAVT